MARMSRPSPFACNICGAEMPFREVEAHQRTMHQEVLQEIKRANQHFGRKFVTIFGPASILMIVTLFSPFMILGVHAPNWYIVLVLWGWIASLPMGWRYARKRTRVEFEVLGNLLYSCRICDVRFPRKDMRTHLAAEHPQELRYVRISAYVVFGFVFGIVAVLFLYVSASILDFLPAVPVNVLRIWFSAALFAWIGSIAVWGTFVDPRHRAKARAAWHATHFGSQPDSLDGIRTLRKTCQQALRIGCRSAGCSRLRRSA